MPKFFTQKLILNCVTAGSRYNVTVTNLTGVTELPEGLSIRLSKELSKGLSDTLFTTFVPWQRYNLILKLQNMIIEE